MRMTASGKALHVLLSLAVIIALMAVPTGLTVPTSDTLAVGSAQPPPGEPGGNHSTPGDNKKKKRDEQRRSDPNWRRGSDQSDSQRQGDSRQGSSERPTSRVGAQQNEGSQQMPRQQTGQPREPHPRYPNRSTDGKYRAGNSGFDGYAEEQASWDAREAQTGTPIERKKIRVKITDPTNPNGPPVTREYDGLEEISPGKYRGLEHKVGSARLRHNQRLADGLVRSGIPGRGVLNGKPIEVVDVEEVHVPTPPPSAVAPAPAAPAAPAAPPPAVAPPAAAQLRSPRPRYRHRQRLRRLRSCRHRRLRRHRSPHRLHRWCRSLLRRWWRRPRPTPVSRGGPCSTITRSRSTGRWW